MIKDLYIVINIVLESFIIDQQKISDPKLIANHFNNFFINIGNSDTHTDKYGFNKYLGHEQSHNFKIVTITNNETIRIITNMKSKHSCGHDSISTALLKQIETEVSPSITLIINQCLTAGIFPNKLKIAKVVPVGPLNVLSIEPGIGGKSPTVTEPQFTTGDCLGPWLLIAIRKFTRHTK